MNKLQSFIDEVIFCKKRVASDPANWPIFPRVPLDRPSRIDVQLEKLMDFVEMVAKDSMRSLICIGAAGIGKSTSIEKEMKRLRVYNYRLVKGATTAKALFRLLYENSTKGRILVLDDCDDILRNRNAQNILKAALDSSASQRLVSWQSETVERGDLPRTFHYDGSLIFVSNLPREKFPLPILSRSYFCDIEATLVDIKSHLWILVDRDSSLSLAEKEALKYEVSSGGHYYQEMNVRTLEKIKTLMRMFPDKWRSLARGSA